MWTGIHLLGHNLKTGHGIPLTGHKFVGYAVLMHVYICPVKLLMLNIPSCHGNIRYNYICILPSSSLSSNINMHCPWDVYIFSRVLQISSDDLYDVKFRLGRSLKLAGWSLPSCDQWPITAANTDGIIVLPSSRRSAYNK